MVPFRKSGHKCVEYGMFRSLLYAFMSYTSHSQVFS